MKKYTEEQVKLIIRYACGYQKAECYQAVGQLLLQDNYQPTDVDLKVLDYLANDIVIDAYVEIKDIIS